MTEEFDPYHVWLGIPADQQPPDHYRLLGVTRFETDQDVIEHAGDQRMAYIRQFQNGPRGALTQQLLNEISAAKLCLLNPEQKAAYDVDLRIRDEDRALFARVKQLPPPVPPPQPPALPEIRTPQATPEPSVLPVPPPPPGGSPALASQPAANLGASETGSPARRRTKRPARRRELAIVLLVLLAVVAAALAVTLWWVLNKSDAFQASEEPRAQQEATKEEPLEVIEEPLIREQDVSTASDADRRLVHQNADGSADLLMSNARLKGDTLRFAGTAPQRTISGFVPNESAAEWSVEFARRGFFRVEVIYRVGDEVSSGDMRLTVGKTGWRMRLLSTAPPRREVTIETIVRVDELGVQPVKLSFDSGVGIDGIELVAIHFAPRG